MQTIARAEGDSGMTPDPLSEALMKRFIDGVVSGEWTVVGLSCESRTDIARLIAALRGKGWVRRRILAHDLVMTERLFRAIAHASGGQIIGSDKGYRLTLEASPEDVRAAIGRLIAQREQMQQRILDIERVYHARKVSAA